MHTVVSMEQGRAFSSCSALRGQSSFLLGCEHTSISFHRGTTTTMRKSKRQFIIQASGSSSEIKSEMERREFLLASSAAAAAAAAGLSQPTSASGTPVQVGNIRACQQATLPDSTQLNCCPPGGASTQAVDFAFDTTLPMRTRRAAQLVDSAYATKYNRAYQLMRALPSSDPRSFMQQANVHCAYCNGAYLQSDGSSSLQIHDNWLFLPWHRWYLYFHERILASLIGDDSFALPYWNWDNQSTTAPLGNVIPDLFVSRSNPALNNRLRDADHLPPRLVDLNYSGEDSSVSDARMRAANNSLMYQQIVSGARTGALFHGQPYRGGDTDAPGGGSLENAPHGPVHVWTGSSSQPNREDMGTLYAAARDPIFFAHHANIDRMWTVWKSLGGRRRDFTDSDWLDATFVFYDEKSRLVRVKVSDALSTEQLSYAYEKAEDAWVTAKPSIVARARALVSTTAVVPGPQPAAAAGLSILADIEEELEEFGEAIAGKFKRLKEVYKSRVRRPVREALEKIKEELDEGDEPEEVLVIQGVEFDCDKPTKFDVFINLPEADENTPTDVVEYAGTFVNVPHVGMQHGTRVTTLRIGIGETLQDLGITEEDEIVVTLVPKGAGKQSPVVFRGIKIEYD